MMSNASKSLDVNKALLVAIGSVALAMCGTAWASAQAVPTAAATEAVSDSSAAVVAPRDTAPFYSLPNVVLRTHEGKNVRFYDDLLKGKIVLINFMYADCKKR